VSIYKELIKNFSYHGIKPIGYIATEDDTKNGLSKWLQCLGTIRDLPAVIDRMQISQVIIAVEKNQSRTAEEIFNTLIEKEVEIKIAPDMIDIISGSVKTNNILGATLIDLQNNLLPYWQQNIKRLFDICFQSPA